MDKELASVSGKEFVMPKVEVTAFDVDDVIAASGNNTGGGFMGEWDDNLPEIDF